MPITSNVTAWTISGDDACSFMHGQTCNDIANLGADQWQINAYLNIKGRVVALFWLKKNTDNSLTVLTSSDLADAVFQRLKMFVLRSKVIIEPSAAGAELLYKQAASQFIGRNSEFLKQLISMGIPSPDWINAQTTDKYLPQMLNLDLVDGLSFKKGCYPGQEIVARTAHRGRLKQRMMLFSTAAGVGESVMLEDGTAAAVIIASDGSLALAITRLEHQEKAFLNATLQALPYDWS